MEIQYQKQILRSLVYFSGLKRNMDYHLLNTGFLMFRCYSSPEVICVVSFMQYLQIFSVMSLEKNQLKNKTY